MSGRTLQLSLPDELAAEIAGAGARGEYGSENDMVVGAVAEWLARRRAEETKIEEWRGLSAEEATALIVNGFVRDVLQQLPMEFAVEAQKLIAISLEGSVG